MRCGIDFGTSNTTMAVVYPDKPSLVPLEQNKVTIPTALFFPEEKDKPILFGRAAQNAYLEGRDGRLLRSLKRILGTSLMDQTTLLQGVRWSFPHILQKFLAHIKQTGEEALGQALDSATIGRPVHFQDNDAEADRRAEEQLRAIALAVGFKEIRFQFEPIAAALAHEKNVSGEKLALVVDIGGGTSDFSVIRLSNSYDTHRNRSQDVLANSGIRIGGNDCDRTLNLAAMMPLLGMGSHYGQKKLEMPARLYFELSEWAKVNWCYTLQNEQFIADTLRISDAPERLQRLAQVLSYHWGHRLLALSEDMKITLSEKEQTHADLRFIEENLIVAWTQQDMNALFSKTLQPIKGTMLNTLVKAQISKEAIALVILTGGSTALPVFQQWIAEIFPQAQILQEDKLGSVGLGLVL